MHKQKILSIMFLMMLVTMVFSSFSTAQTDSLAVWENISGGVLVSDWGENTGAEWYPYNDSGEGVYNFTGLVWGYAIDDDTYGHRWMQTFDFASDDAENGVMVIQAWNNSNESDDFYAMIYYLVGPESAGPEAYLAYYMAGTPWYYNGTGYETNISNATNYADQADEYDYQSGAFVRVKALWNWYEATNDFSARLKIWDAEGGDEPTTWLIDDTFDNYVDYGDDYYPGIGADHTFVGLGTSQFRRIYFWNLSYDMIGDIPYIGVPQYDMGDFLELWDDIGDYDYWNLTVAYRNLFNRFDLTSYLNYNDIIDAGGNDTIYIFSILLTGVLDVYEEWTGEEWDGEAVFPNNILLLMAYQTTDTTAEGDTIEWDDMFRIRFDFDNDGYDATDYTFYMDGTSELFGYQGWTQRIPDSPIEFYGVGGYGEHDDDGWGRLFRDSNYPGYMIMLNWDLISGNTDAGEYVNISISLYDNETGNYSVWQDWNETDEDTYKTGTDNLTWMETTWNTTTLWGLMMIEGGALDFEDPYVLGAHIDAQTENLLQVILPILLAVAIFILIVNMALTGGITKESLITLMIVAVIGVVIIQVILEL